MFSLALTSTGQVLAWGDNLYGQLGDGTTSDSDSPVRVRLPAGTTVTAISAGQDFALARTSRGHVLAWGHGDGGRLGDGSSTSSDKPVGVALPAGTRVRAVSAGCTDSYALTVKGSVLAWGYNGFGELGDGSDTQSSTPVRVELPAGWRASAVIAGPGADHALAMVHKKS